MLRDELLEAMQRPEARKLIEYSANPRDFLGQWNKAHIWGDYVRFDDAFWTLKCHSGEHRKILHAAQHSIEELVGDVVVVPDRDERDRHPIFLSDKGRLIAPEPAGSHIDGVWHVALCSGSEPLREAFARIDGGYIGSLEIVPQGDERFLLIARSGGAHHFDTWMTRGAKR